MPETSTTSPHKKLFRDSFKLSFFQLLVHIQLGADNMDQTIERLESEDTSSVKKSIDLLAKQLDQMISLKTMLEELNSGGYSSEMEKQEKEKFWELHSQIEDMLLKYCIVYASYLRKIKKSEKTKQVVKNLVSDSEDYEQVKNYIQEAGIEKQVLKETKDHLSNYKASLNALENAVE